MSGELRQRLFDELDALVLIDPHTHINPHQPAAGTLASDEALAALREKLTGR